MLKRFCSGTSPLELVEEREAIFYLLPQTTPDRLHKNLSGYTIDPKTRYLNLSEGREGGRGGGGKCVRVYFCA